MLRKQISLNKATDTEAPVHERFPVGDIDFLAEWNYEKLCEYRRNLINSVASMEAQLARSDFKGDMKAEWLYSTTFLHTKAKLMLSEVSARIRFLEQRELGPALVQAASKIFEPVDLADLMAEAGKTMGQAIPDPSGLLP